MGERLKDRVAIVTGAGRGIGRGVALLLAEEGASVVVNDLGANVDGTDSSAGPADEVVAEIRSAGGTAVANHDSVATFDGAGEIVNTAIANFGKVDILCHVAGILRDRMIFNMAEEEWDAVLAVHLKGAFNTVRQVVPHMIERNYGRICLFSSGSGLGNTGQANYSAAKEGMVGFARSLARELDSHGITVNAIYPGGATRMTGTVPDTAQELRAARGVIGGGQMAGRTQDMEQAARDPPEQRSEGGLPVHRGRRPSHRPGDRDHRVANVPVFAPSRNSQHTQRWALDPGRTGATRPHLPGVGNRQSGPGARTGGHRRLGPGAASRGTCKVKPA